MVSLGIRTARRPLVVIALYVITGVGWCAFSNYVMVRLVIFSVPSLIASTIRVLGFIGFSAVGLYLVLNRLRTSEDRYRRLLDSAPLPILVHDGRDWTQINAEATRMLGAFGPNQCDGMWDRIHSDDRAAVTDLLARATLNSSERVPCRLRRTDGTMMDTEWCAMSIESGGKRLVQVMVHDVTERKRMEDELLRSEARLSQALQVGHMGHWEWDMVTGKRTWSEEKCRIFGIESFDGRFETLISCVHPDDRDRVLSFLGQAATAGKGFDIEYRIIRPNDGTTRVVHVRSKVILNEYHQPCRMIGATQDVTDQKVADELLLHSEKLAAVGQLAAGIAHEIRNPLTSLKGFLQLLPSSPQDVQTRYCGIMRDELQRIGTIVDGLLFLAKPQTLSFSLTDIREKLTEVVALLATQAALCNVQIITDFRAGVPSIWCEGNQMKQVFINIVTNGIESMPDGGTLTIWAEATERHITIAFRDEGIGIAQETLKRLGDPFYTTKEQGTGLGLVVSRNIIHSHQGRLHIDSELGAGTTVYIQLPLVNVQTRFV